MQGKIEVQGTPAELARSGFDFAELVGENDENDESRRPYSRQGSMRSFSSQTSLCSVLGEPFDAIELPIEAEPINTEHMEKSSKGQVKGNRTNNYFGAGAHWFVLFLLCLLFIITQFIASGADYWVSYFTKQEELRVFFEHHNASTDNNGTAYADIEPPWLSTDDCLYIHGGLMVALFILAAIRSFGFYSIAVRASQKLHDTMFTGIISTTMRFFDTNPGGRILNRFSKDMGAVDEFLPKAFLDSAQVILNMGGAIVVTAIVNPLFLVPLIVLALVFLFIRKIYLKTSKNIKRLESISKCSCMTHEA